MIRHVTLAKDLKGRRILYLGKLDSFVLLLNDFSLVVVEEAKIIPLREIIDVEYIDPSNVDEIRRAVREIVQKVGDVDFVVLPKPSALI